MRTTSLTPASQAGTTYLRGMEGWALAVCYIGLPRY